MSTPSRLGGGHRERVDAALRLARPDGIPVSFWGHNFARENSAEELANETARLALRYDWDFVKVQSRFSCFAEAWGVRWQPSRTPTERPHQLTPLVNSAHALARVADATVDYRPLAEQLDALRLLRQQLSDDRPILMTAFSPLMVLSYMYPDSGDSRRAMLADLRDQPVDAAHVLGAISDLIRRFVVDCVDAGADGVYFASNLASADISLEDDLVRFGRPFDLPILTAIAEAPFNIVHVCGERAQFALFADYPAAAFSWAVGGGNPTLAEGRRLTGKAVAGGISAKPQLRSMEESEVQEEAMAAIDETGGSGLLLAPGCSIDADTPEPNLIAARRVARTPLA